MRGWKGGDGYFKTYGHHKRGLPDKMAETIYWHFNPHRPHRRWRMRKRIRYTMRHFNPHLPHRRWRREGMEDLVSYMISIHTFLTEGDNTVLLVAPVSEVFQSTPSSQKVTSHWKEISGDCEHFNPHLPHRRWQQFSTTPPPLPPLSLTILYNILQQNQ